MEISEYKIYISTTLMKEVLERFKTIRQIVLTTDSIPKAIAFYETQGFIQMTNMGCCGFMKASYTN